MNERIRIKLETLPSSTGVYKFLDNKGKILYVGKAINLKSRVSSYFRDMHFDRPRIQQMIPLIEDIQIQETNNEIEALVLESALVREIQPLFNSALKDDKSYAWIFVSTGEEFPTVKIVRSLNKGEYKKGKMFGPYPSGYTIQRVYRYLRRIYPFCTCKNKDCRSSLDFHIGLCPGPYAGAISKDEYRKNIDNIVKFLNGKQGNHIKRLEKEMMVYSKDQNFEKAAQLRDRIRDLKYVGESINFTYYDDISSYKSRREQSRRKSFESLELELGIENLHRIECYDISNMQGKHAYGSMVVVVDGELKRSDYRIFKIKGQDTPNDPAMLKEVFERRFRTVTDDIDSSLSSRPDIVLIDGAITQISTVKGSIPSGIVVMGISKGKHIKRAGGMKVDEFWILKEGEILQANIQSPEVLIDLRNEAHRFAISHYRRRSIKESKKSILDSIPGVGEKRKKLLKKRYGSIEELRKAPIDEIVSIIKNRDTARRIKEVLN
jgi:excinuclease ABC subunit C